MQIDNLPIPHLLNLTHEQQLQLILQVRMRRRVLPEKRTPAHKRAKGKALINLSLDLLSHEQLLQLAALLNKE